MALAERPRQHALDALGQWANRRLARHLLLKAFLICGLAALAFTLPPAWVPGQWISSAYEGIQAFFWQQAEAPFSPIAYDDPSSNLSKRAFRLVPPLLAHLLGLGPGGMLWLVGLSVVAVLALSLHLAQRQTQDPATTLLMGLATATGLVVACGIHDIYHLYDTLAIALLLGALACGLGPQPWRPLAVGALVYLAAFTDERALVASPLVYLGLGLPPQGLPRARHLLPWAPAQRGLLVGLALALATRALLWATMGLHVPVGGEETSVGLALLRLQHRISGLSIWSGLEALWVLPLLGLSTLALAGRWVWAAAWLLAMALVAGVALSVADVTRSMVYLFPTVFVGLGLAARTERPRTLRGLALAAAVVGALAPNYQFSGAFTLRLYYSALDLVYLKLLRHLDALL